jgi:Subtilase family
MPRLREVRRAAATALLVLPLFAAPALAAGDDRVPAPDKRGVADWRLRDAAGATVRVEALVAPGRQAAAARAVARLGGVVEGFAGRTLVQALVPTDSVAALERHADAVRAPLIANAPPPPQAPASEPGTLLDALVAGEELIKTKALAWHAAGLTGQGVKVGIVDFFDGAAWAAGEDADELPAALGTFCLRSGAPCNLWAGGNKHGVGVAEIVHEMAPGAQLYLATVETAADLQAAVDYFAARGVRVISRSLTAELDGAGDGSGPIAEVIDRAVARGIAWFNSAGNNAGRDGDLGTYWRGPWRDEDGDSWLDWAPGEDWLEFRCSFMNGLRWSDWDSSTPTDYDLYVYEDNPSQNPRVSANTQPGAPPLEHLGCDGDRDFVRVRLFDAGGGTDGDVLELMVNGGWFEHFVNPHSASGPASDSASPGALSIGAVDPPLLTSIAVYSSEGPTNDDRVKPDLSAAACVASFTFRPACFNGTSAATPGAAGAAALVIGSGKATTPAAVKAFLLEQAAVERDAPGPDNLFGAGELVLPAPVAPSPQPPPPPSPPPPPPPPSDTQRPSVRALESSGRRGRVARLRYAVRDDSGVARQQVVVSRSRRRLKTIVTAYGAARGQRASVSWHVPRRTRRGRLRFCVSANDRAGNATPSSCAALRIR